MFEVWRDVSGYEGLYQVSNFGRVRSLPRNTTSGKILTLGVGTRGRLGCRFSKNGKFQSKDVASMVATAFLGPSNGLSVLHWDDDVSNNHASNLRYGTQADNMKDMVRNGHSLKGSKHHKSKLDEARVVSIKRRLAKGHNHHDIAADYSVSPETIQAIKHGRNWGWLSAD